MTGDSEPDELQMTRATVVRVVLIALGSEIAVVTYASVAEPPHRLTDILIYLLLALPIAGALALLSEYLYRTQTFVRYYSRNLREATQKLGDVGRILRIHENAWKMIAESDHHADLLKKLIIASTSRHFNSIPYVNPNSYLNYLEQALSMSSDYRGVQRKPIGWFKENNNGEKYMNVLKERSMKVKIRLFIIDDSEVERMKQELTDEDTMTWYTKVSSDISSYWTSRSSFTEYAHRDPPEDFALYDLQLLIKYNESLQTLSFALCEAESEELTAFRVLEEQIRTGSQSPFILIPGSQPVAQQPLVPPHTAAKDAVPLVGPRST